MKEYPVYLRDERVGNATVLRQGLYCRVYCRCRFNGEGFFSVQERAVSKLKELVEKHKGEDFVIAAHGGVNRTLLCYALDLPLRYMWNIRQDNTAVNVISFYEGGRITVDLMNDTHHLEKK